MILTTLLAIAFGSFGTGANGNNYYNNTMYLSSGLVTVAVAKNTSTYSALQVKCDVVANCDFRETKNAQGNTEYWVHFNSWVVDLKAYNISNDSFSTLVHSTTYYNNFESSLVNEPNNKLEMYYYFSQTTTSGTLSFYTSWYDYALDEDSGITASTSSPLYNSNVFVQFPNSNSIVFDLDNLQSQLVNAFNMGAGGYAGGYEFGYADGTENGKSIGYTDGYTNGYSDAMETDTTAFTIFNGILAIGMTPINVFLKMLNFQVFGIDVSTFITSLMTLMITLWFIRVISGGNGGSKK